MTEQGSGDVLGSVDIGIGTIEVVDDGDPDHYIYLRWVDPDGNDVENTGITSTKDALDMDYDEVENRLSSPATTSSSSEYSSPFPDGPFACDECSRTWPGSKNHGTGDEDLCPECADK